MATDRILLSVPAKSASAKTVRPARLLGLLWAVVPVCAAKSSEPRW